MEGLAAKPVYGDLSVARTAACAVEYPEAPESNQHLPSPIYL